MSGPCSVSVVFVSILQNLESSSELKANANSLETKPQSEVTPELKEETIPREAKEESLAIQVNMVI